MPAVSIVSSLALGSRERLYSTHFSPKSDSSRTTLTSGGASLVNMAPCVYPHCIEDIQNETAATPLATALAM